MRVLIVDDQEMLLEVFDAILSRNGITVETAVDLEDALEKITEKGRFDLILLDYNMPGMDGVDGILRALEKGQGTPVALMSGNLPQHIVRDAMQIGAAGCLPKKLPGQKLIDSVRSMAAGNKVNLFEIGPEIGSIGGDDPSKRLTQRETLVLTQLDQGKDLSAIASELGLKEVTVTFVVKMLCRKFNAASPGEAVIEARKLGSL